MPIRVFYQQQHPSDWREQAKLLRLAREKFREEVGIMTPHERQSYERDLNERANAYRPAIQQGILQEYEGSISAFQKSLRGIDFARAREIARWKPNELMAEIQLAQALIGQALGPRDTLTKGPGAGEKLQELYVEAKLGSKEKYRAFAEIVKSLDSKGDPVINRLSKLASRDLQDLRTTDELIEAHRATKAALDQLGERQEELRQVSVALGEGDPAEPFASGVFGQAYKRVQRDREGKVYVYPANSPEVTGVKMPEPTPAAGGE